MSLDIVQEYDRLVQASDIDAAAKHIADDVSAFSPRGSYTGIENWRAAMIHLETDRVDWTDFEQGENENEFVCSAVKKLGFVKVSIKRTITLNDDNKIQSIAVTIDTRNCMCKTA